MKRQSKGIKRELVSFTIGCIICIVFVLSTGSICFTYDTTRKSLSKSLKETSELVSEKITQQLEAYSIISESIALYMKGNAQREGNISIFLRISCSQYGLNNIDIISSDGLSVVNGKSYEQDNAYLQAKKGTPFLSDPIIHKDSASFEYAYPYDDLVIMIEFPYSVFETMISDAKLGNTGSTYILNRDGTKVAHEDFSLVLSQQNDAEAAKTNQAVYGEIAKLETAMVNGETGFGFYRWNGENKFGSYTPVKNTNGWSVNVTASESEFMSGVITSMLSAVILGLISLILAVFAMLRITDRITGPIGKVVDSIDQLSAGDLSIELYMERRDEIGRIGEKVHEMAGKYRDIIYDISRFLQEISYGNLTVQSNCEYPGEFNGIRSSMEMIASRLNDTILNIRSSAEEVNRGAGQVSGASQALASGAAVQAATVEELNASIADVSDKAVKNTDRVRNAKDYVNQSGVRVNAGNRYMQSLNSAMEEVSLSSEKISGITKMIEDIAFQTNILALNAAVEAARAGSAGRGFAVVAGEVRNLSAKSAEAAKQTAELIGHTVKAVSEGKKRTDETAVILKEIAEKSILVEQVIEEIESASKEQAQAMEQVSKGLSEVSAVVQSNAAAAEESSASSEELAAQARTLRQEVAKFKLPEE
ncbi:methyl-accepting chemotaxis protein [Clostridium sp. Marseille-P2415]|uniref:methyl-accepting chemotaxis protein n=1 Tax=Clostridium sp. Marseille-P2415 TaxID=1805471 RepID=UPI0009884AB5|nr:methyl-accepting chemotaxis protein [Clostridium sp. Marseille-P2415]